MMMTDSLLSISSHIYMYVMSWPRSVTGKKSGKIALTAWYIVELEQVSAIIVFCFPWDEVPDSPLIRGLFPSA